MADSSAELLERAAAMLEQMAKPAAAGPWRVDHLLASSTIKTGEGSPYPGDHLANVGNRFTAAWIATMSPAVAAPLVGLLRTAAKAHGEYGDVPLDFLRSDEVAPAYRYTHEFVESALEFARRVLGEHTEEPS